jgi:lycopene beta-cyclase
MYDLILAGGGLANGLLAYRLSQQRPELRLLLIEAGSTLGGNHTWSFFGSDLTAAQARWMTPLVEYRWPNYDVVFPGLRRRLHTDYATFTSERFHEVLMEALGDAVMLNADIQTVTPDAVVLGSGERFEAAAVIDGRGFRRCPSLMIGYQKFTGDVVTLAEDHGLSTPVLMDATVPQRDGFRFFYVLPLGPRQLLIEDTRYSDDAALDPDGDGAGIEAYAQDRGWHVQTVLRRETGVLPVALAGDVTALWADAGVPQAGMRAGLFHATTGYSLPEAVRLADRIAAMAELSSAVLYREISRYAAAHWLRQGFYRLLNRMLFLAARPELRYRVFERFYGLSAGLIERFYADRLTRYDRLRILSGRPPVPFFRALSVVRESTLTEA